jgi:hypothetical protein
MILNSKRLYHPDVNLGNHMAKHFDDNETKPIWQKLWHRNNRLDQAFQNTWADLFTAMKEALDESGI